MSVDVYERIRANPKYQELIAARGRFAWTLSAIVLILFYGFVIAVAYMPKTLGQPISAGSVLTIGVALEFFLFIFFWGLSAYYVQRANSRYDALTKEVIREALKETK